LLGREDLVELGLGLLLKFGNLLDLVVGQVQFLDDEGRQQMESAATTTGTAPAARTGTARAAGTTVVLAAGTWRTVGGTFLRGRPHGKGGNRQDAEDRKESRKTPHGETPRQENHGMGSSHTIIRFAWLVILPADLQRFNLVVIYGCHAC
jgi:hypothetical protein